MIELMKLMISGKSSICKVKDYLSFNSKESLIKSAFFGQYPERSPPLKLPYYADVKFIVMDQRKTVYFGVKSRKELLISDPPYCKF